MKSKQKPNPVEDLRKCAGVTLREAAKAAGVAPSTILLVERGQGRLTDQQVESLGNFYAQRLAQRGKRMRELLGTIA